MAHKSTPAKRLEDLRDALARLDREREILAARRVAMCETELRRGASLRDVAACSGLSPATVSKIRDRAGIDARPVGRPPTEEETA
jgi:hypothetical protein